MRVGFAKRLLVCFLTACVATVAVVHAGPAAAPAGTSAVAVASPKDGPAPNAAPAPRPSKIVEFPYGPGKDAVGGPGENPNGFSIQGPSAWTVGGDGRVYVLDALKHRILRVNLDVGTWSVSLDYGEAGPGSEPWFASDLVVSRNGTVAIVIAEPPMILIFGPDGEPRQKIAKLGERDLFRYPGDLFLDESLDFFYANETTGPSLYRFSFDGLLEFEIPGLSEPGVDRKGRVHNVVAEGQSEFRLDLFPSRTGPGVRVGGYAARKGNSALDARLIGSDEKGFRYLSLLEAGADGKPLADRILRIGDGGELAADLVLPPQVDEVASPAKRYMVLRDGRILTYANDAKAYRLIVYPAF